MSKIPVYQPQASVSALTQSRWFLSGIADEWSSSFNRGKHNMARTKRFKARQRKK